jgi:hypothetical protein
VRRDVLEARGEGTDGKEAKAAKGGPDDKKRLRRDARTLLFGQTPECSQETQSGRTDGWGRRRRQQVGWSQCWGPAGPCSPRPVPGGAEACRSLS